MVNKPILEELNENNAEIEAPTTKKLSYYEFLLLKRLDEVIRLLGKHGV